MNIWFTHLVHQGWTEGPKEITNPRSGVVTFTHVQPTTSSPDRAHQSRQLQQSAGGNIFVKMEDFSQRGEYQDFWTLRKE